MRPSKRAKTGGMLSIYSGTIPEPAKVTRAFIQSLGRMYRAYRVQPVEGASHATPIP